MGYLRVDFAEVRTAEGRRYLLVAIDRTSKVAFAELQPRATRMVADFLRRVLAKLPYKRHTVVTDNGVQVTWQVHQWVRVGTVLRVAVAPSAWSIGGLNPPTPGPTGRSNASSAR